MSGGLGSTPKPSCRGPAGLGAGLWDQVWEVPIPSVPKLPHRPRWSIRNGSSVGTGTSTEKLLEPTSPSQPMGTSAGALTQLNPPGVFPLSRGLQSSKNASWHTQLTSPNQPLHSYFAFFAFDSPHAMKATSVMIYRAAARTMQDGTAHQIPGMCGRLTPLFRQLINFHRAFTFTASFISTSRVAQLELNETTP